MIENNKTQMTEMTNLYYKGPNEIKPKKEFVESLSKRPINYIYVQKLTTSETNN